MQKLVLIVRMDIGMSQGKIAAQCAHAALECYLKASRSFRNFLSTRAWLLMGQPKIVLKVQTEQELKRLANEAEQVGLITSTIIDAGKTELKRGTITVLGIGPGAVNKINNVTSHLRLL